jgi:hypothetical protein
VTTKAPKPPKVFDYSHLPVYRPLVGGPEVVLVDFDGTLCWRAEGGRGPYDETRVFEDLVCWPVLRTVCALAVAGVAPVFMSGRREASRADSERWLQQHVPVKGLGLFMRADGDLRPDWQVKYDLFTEHVAPHFRVFAVLDDRQQVVDMWRAIGLTVFQVAVSPD